MFNINTYFIDKHPFLGKIIQILLEAIIIYYSIILLVNLIKNIFLFIKHILNMWSSSGSSNQPPRDHGKPNSGTGGGTGGNPGGGSGGNPGGPPGGDDPDKNKRKRGSSNDIDQDKADELAKAKADKLAKARARFNELGLSNPERDAETEKKRIKDKKVGIS
jgi:hypothetical protein